MKTADVMQIAIEKIDIPRGYPAADPRTVSNIATSFGGIGQRTPITIRHVKGEGWILVAGRNRLAAAKKLGWKRIACVADNNPTTANIWHLVENFHRKDMPAAEKATVVVELATLFKQLEESETEKGVATRHLFGKKLGRGQKGGISEAARKIGVPRSTVTESLKIDSILPEVKAAAKESNVTSRDDLLKIARAPKAKQMEKVAEIASKAAERANAKAAGDNLIMLNPIMQAWSHATKKQRREFIAEMFDDIQALKDEE